MRPPPLAAQLRLRHRHARPATRPLDLQHANVPTPAGTFSPKAIVPGPGASTVSSAPLSKARTSGAIASLCTHTMRGRCAPIRPSASSSPGGARRPGD
jgi:hypothetical protein